MLVVLEDMIEGKFVQAIPLGWIGKLQFPVSGRAYQLAIYVWYLKGWKKDHKDLVISLKALNEVYKFDKQSLNRAITELVEKGLVTAERKAGKSPRITILCEEYYKKGKTNR